MKTSKKKNKVANDEYIAVSQNNRKYRINSLFSEDLKINSKKADIKIFENEEGFTYLLWKNRKYLAEIIEKNQNKYTVLLNGISHSFSIESPISYKRKKYLDKHREKSKTEAIIAPMPGKIIDLLVEENSDIKEGEPILILEAMKMQNEINSHVTGKIKKILVKQNDSVAKDEVLLEIEK
ncbi:MAG: acetyl-CoA carboxylase biotin carboxyl carrier protein subunit [Bacteroidales bacterium]|nr:MAG: acetyl-CoA carboxylase biotin carboxyl carrier protein subunit [Bacteroidales bacterium]